MLIGYMRASTAEQSLDFSAKRWSAPVASASTTTSVAERPRIGPGSTARSTRPARATHLWFGSLIGSDAHFPTSSSSSRI